MHYSPEATRRSRRVYRLAQFRQAVRSSVVAGIACSFLCGVTWLYVRRAVWRLQDTSASTPQTVTATGVGAAVITQPRGGYSCYITFDNVAGHQASATLHDSKIVFAVGERARVHYSIGRSGELYTGEVEPLP